MTLPDRATTGPDRTSPYRGVRALVLGGSGFIGRWVARELAAAGAEVHASARDPAGARAILEAWGAAAARVHDADLAAPGEVRRLLEETRPAVVFNLAGHGVDPAERDPAAAEALNVRLVEDLAAAVAAVEAPYRDGLRLVHVGSAAEYGRASGDLAEGTPERPDTLYGRTKLAGTRALAAACAETGLRAATARLFTVFGPGEHDGRLLPTLLEAARTGDDVPLTDGRHERDLAHVEDVARALLALARSDAAPGEVVNVATGRLTTVRTFVETAARVLGLAPERLRFGALPTRAEEMRHRPVNVERMRRLLGAPLPADVAAGVARTQEFLDRVGAGRSPAPVPEERR